MQNIVELTVEELKQVLKDWKKPEFHGRQIFAWIYKKQVTDFAAMSDLSEDLRRRLKDNFCLIEIKLVDLLHSRDGTEKFLFVLRDKNLIESVIIPTEKRLTACISTQVGCKFSCTFCASGLLGFKRNLTTAEIIEQILYLKNKSKNQKLTHLVFMGVGEPLDNYDNLLKAIRIINSAQGLQIAARRITISTSGVIPAIKRLSTEGLQIELSISLHAADEKIRSQIMPINKKYPIKELIKACREYIKQTNRQITFEYVLIKDINSGLQSAVKLGRILKGLNAKVNLIPANVIRELKIEPPDKQETSSFRDSLLKQGINVTSRRPRGQDIQAACGQLRLRYENK